ncbi:MAG TPA: hypothetical protein VFU31_22130 [Candidatus Binatia bacterium]|nr:hypothetical protein [Candidatus Binatia bacterium]
MSDLDFSKLTKAQQATMTRLFSRSWDIYLIIDALSVRTLEALVVRGWLGGNPDSRPTIYITPQGRAAYEAWAAKQKGQ